VSEPNPSKFFWDRAARENAAWHIATGYTTESEAFFDSGKREVDEFLRLAGLSLNGTEELLEVGSGVGRMTRHLAALVQRVVAVDVSAEMLSRARANLAGVGNVEFVEVSGAGDLPLGDSSVDAVFSYVTMQHVPTSSAQERYFAESLRVLRPGGWVFLQFRRSGLVPRLLDWVGHVGHSVVGRRTLNKAWRGARVKERVLLAYSSADVSVEILHLSRRHIWARATKR
jgi:ubiquinone/menaquinone biosynthesis C-methylase UbiE